MIGFRYKKYLVTKAPDKLNDIEIKGIEITTKKITIEDIEKDAWLSERKQAFKQMLKKGHIGLISKNKDTDEIVAYGWIAINELTPSHIPKIPQNAGWLHYDRVKDSYRGYGYQKVIIKERVNYLRNCMGIKDIYIDTSENNIASRINQKKLGFIDSGIYRVLDIGTKRVPFLNFKFGK